jgi:hypothetical protein
MKVIHEKYCIYIYKYYLTRKHFGNRIKQLIMIIKIVLIFKNIHNCRFSSIFDTTIFCFFLKKRETLLVKFFFSTAEQENDTNQNYNEYTSFLERDTFTHAYKVQYHPLDRI